jgi:hypothetical protein
MHYNPIIFSCFSIRDTSGTTMRGYRLCWLCLPYRLYYLGRYPYRSGRISPQHQSSITSCALGIGLRRLEVLSTYSTKFTFISKHNSLIIYKFYPSSQLWDTAGCGCDIFCALSQYNLSDWQEPLFTWGRNIDEKKLDQEYFYLL